MKLRERVAALLGVSAYTAPERAGASMSEAAIEKIRSLFGGQLTPLHSSQLRWFLADLETAIYLADRGDLSAAARLWRAMKIDGSLVGVLKTRTQSVASLPKRFSGDDDIVRVLQGRDGVRSVFDAMCPPTELTMMAADGLGIGVSLGELLPVEGRDYPVLVRRDPEFLRYVWAENRWYFLSIAGPLPITPGDGKWVLHIEGGREAPWQAGLWPALGASWIRKSHAQLHKSNWEAKLANPARAAVAPAASSEAQRAGFIERMIGWGINTVFELPPGWDVKIIESNGNGHESFDETVDRSNREYAIAITGQVMTTDGGEGFSNGDVGEGQLEKLVAATCEALAYTINTQVIPPFVIERWGELALERAPVLSWDTTPPKDEKDAAAALKAFGDGVAAANVALAPYGKRLDAVTLAAQNGYPLVDIEPTSGGNAGGDGDVVSDDVDADDTNANEDLDVDGRRAA
ncbi:MAG: hypothetical protein QOG85_8 [Gaiellaceae bacterium]|nr:hypothetical protein [Gaiellaceae bacterium]